jgi:tetratricopeptide (TPR) repeat protein
MPSSTRSSPTRTPTLWSRPSDHGASAQATAVDEAAGSDRVIEPGAEEVLLGRFRLVRVLGPDGISRSWLAEDAELRETVLLRILAPELASSKLGHDCLRGVCRETRRLGHPNIAQLYDFHRDQSICLLSREYVDGEGVARLRGLPPDQIAARILPVLDALVYAHARGVIHGDLKANKLLCDADGTLRLADFRVAAALREALRDLGPPDLAEDPGRPSASDDVSGLGGVLFELMAGRPLVAADDEGIAATLRDAGVPAGLAELVERMRAKSRSLRPGLESVRAALDPAGTSRPHDPPRESGAGPLALPSTARPAVPREASLTRSWIGAAFLILSLVAAAVFFYLPRWVGNRAVPVSESASMGAPGAGSVDLAERERAAERLLAMALEARQRLEARGVEQWAQAEAQRVRDRIAAGESAQLAADFERASESYHEALRTLQELSERAPVVLEEAIVAGTAALAEGRDEEAVRQFSLAQLIDSDSAAAADGLARATHWSEVAALLASGARHEEVEQFVEARESYAAALEIDPGSASAAEGLERVKARLLQLDYSQRMSRATRALAENDLDAALENVKAAQTARPGSADAKALRARIVSLRTTRSAALHLGRARAAEQAADWSRAADEYRAVLALDPDATAATAGVARSELGARLAGRFGAWIGQPDLLLDRRERNEAGDLVAEARGFADPPARFADEIQRVEALLAAYSAPVNVVVESDGATEVAIQKLRTLGSFERLELELHPGNYVVVGVRRGYRDVRQTLTVRPGGVQPTVVVRCTKPI